MSAHPAPAHHEAATLSTMRSFLIGLFLLGVLGTGIELVLLEHMEDTWQLVPLVLMGLSLLVLGWYAATRSQASLRTFQGTMILFVVSGLIGVFLHYQANAEFELEMYPSMQGVELFWESVRGAMPALAPGTMIGLGLLGLLVTYRHPKLETTSSFDNQSEPA